MLSLIDSVVTAARRERNYSDLRARALVLALSLALVCVLALALAHGLALVPVSAKKQTKMTTTRHHIPSPHWIPGTSGGGRSRGGRGGGGGEWRWPWYLCRRRR